MLVKCKSKIQIKATKCDIMNCTIKIQTSICYMHIKIQHLKI